MQKKLLIVTVCIIFVLVIVGIIITTRNSERTQQIERILQEDSEEKTALVSLEEVRKEADAVIEAGRNGKYRNLQFNEIRPLITEEDQIYRIKVSAPDVPTTEENLQKVLDMMQTLLGETIDERHIEVSASVPERFTVEELREGIQKQDEKFMDMYYLFYLDEERARCAQINSFMNSIWINRGLEGVAPSEEDYLERLYYPGAIDGSLQDVYETVSGGMSVEEAIKQVENYFNNEFPVAISKELEYRVARVYILKMPDGTYGFNCALTASYGGVRFESANSGVTLQEEDGAYDIYSLAMAVLDRENHVLFFNGFTCNDNIEEIEEILEVIPLERAVEYISQKIGDNTIYTVKEIELTYMGKYKITEGGKSFYEIWTPKWIFFTTNETSGKDVRFYVDVVTGEVETREISD